MRNYKELAISFIVTFILIFLILSSCENKKDIDLERKALYRIEYMFENYYCDSIVCKNDGRVIVLLYGSSDSSHVLPKYKTFRKEDITVIKLRK